MWISRVRRVNEMRKELWFRVGVNDYSKLRDYLVKRNIDFDIYLLVHPKLDFLYRLVDRLPTRVLKVTLLTFIFLVSDLIIGSDNLLLKVVIRR
jgi:hypothetical protein